MIAEKRYCEIRASGRMLEGTAVSYSDVATFPWGRESISPNAFSPLGDVILNRQHKRDIPLARTGGGGLELIDSPEALRISAELPATGSADETLALVKGKILRGFSIEFIATAERQDGDLRIIEKARLVGVGVVDDPQYPQSLVSARAKELRARSGRTLRARIPAKMKLACQCSGAECKFARFSQAAVDEMLDTAFAKVEGEIGNDVIAAWSSFDNPLASVGKRTLRRAGDGGIEIDIPLGASGDALLDAHENAGVILRPFLNAAESVGEVQGDIMEYSRARVRAFIVSSSDQREGWPPVEIIGSASKAPKRRARFWL